MANQFFQFKQFRIDQEKCGMKVCTDSCLFGAWISVPSTAKTILDIGTGTGLLSLMLAQKTNANITGIEIDNGAFEQTSANFKNSSWSKKLTVVQGDVRTYPFNEKFDFIVCNPPFFKDKIISFSQAEKIAKHSTHLSLEELFASIDRLLNENGKCALLFPFFRKQEIEQLAIHYHFEIAQTFYFKQTPSHDYFRYAVLLSKEKTVDINHLTCSIKNADDSYSDTAVALLQPYYLYL